MDMTVSARRARRFGLGGVLIVSALALGGCTNPYDPGQRALGGAAIGAGTGAAISAATGGDAATGAILGGAVGAIGGMLTTPQPAPRGYYGGQRYARSRDYRDHRDGEYRDRSRYENRDGSDQSRRDRYYRDRNRGYQQGYYPQDGYQSGNDYNPQYGH